MININLKGKTPQRIKYTDIVTIERIGKTVQKKTIEKQTKGILLIPGDNKIDEKEYHRIEKSPWFVLLVERNDIIVKGVSVKKQPTVKAVNKKADKVVTIKRNK